ncbi:sensor domain-containing diguanylate cyclase [bacterium]|nr:sensor domain-containing diguanylate cyclase [bacterium]
MADKTFPSTYFEKIIENISGGVYIVNTSRKVIYWNKGAEAITGFSNEEMMGKECAFVGDKLINGHGEKPCDDKCPFNITSKATERRKGDELFFLHKAGHRIPVIVRSIPLLNKDGEVEAMGEYFFDNSIFVLALEQLEKFHNDSTVDKLTGIGNRRYAESHLKYLSKRNLSLNDPFSLLFVDIDDFKKINDVFGHETGDKILQMTVNSLKSGLRGTDLLFRWGGEEFLIILPSTELERIKSIGERCRMLVENSSIEHEGQRISVTVSLGGTQYISGEDSLIAVDRADTYLYSSKKDGKNITTIGK